MNFSDVAEVEELRQNSQVMLMVLAFLLLSSFPVIFSVSEDKVIGFLKKIIIIIYIYKNRETRLSYRKTFYYTKVR